MDFLIDNLLYIIDRVGSSFAIAAVIMYLIYFHRTHKREHKAILDRLDTSEKTDEIVIDRIEDSYKLILRGLITNDNLPVSVRMDMYDEYKRNGGNSWIDQYAEEQLFGRTDGKYGRRSTDTKYGDYPDDTRGPR